MEKQGRKIQELRGTVVSDKMKDTAVVLVHRFVKHKKYQKYYQISTRYKADDKGNAHKIGEKVAIVPCRPISKDKHFRIV